MLQRKIYGEEGGGDADCHSESDGSQEREERSNEICLKVKGLFKRHGAPLLVSDSGNCCNVFPRLRNLSPLMFYQLVLTPVDLQS